MSKLLPPPWTGIVLPSPDQARYGPATIQVSDDIPHERDGLLLYAWEGGGWSVTCSCGTLFRWHTQKTQVQTWGREHTAPRKQKDSVTCDCPTLRKKD